MEQKAIKKMCSLMKEGLKPDTNYPQVLQETIWACQKGLKNLLM